jgi:energy-converting hydrogenase Eha subunit G
MKTAKLSFLALIFVALAVLAPSACASTGTAVVGHSVTFYLIAISGTTPITYQWQKNGTNIPGATGIALPAGVTGIANSAYTIASVSAGDAGVYTVVATNNAGSATSDTATLTINSAPNGAVTGVQVTQNGVTTPYNFSS